MNPFMKMLNGIKSYMYEALKAGISMPVAGATGGSVDRTKQDNINAGKSKRVMLMQRGSQPEHRKARRFDRNKTLHIKKFKPSLVGA